MFSIRLAELAQPLCSSSPPSCPPQPPLAPLSITRPRGQMAADRCWRLGLRYGEDQPAQRHCPHHEAVERRFAMTHAWVTSMGGPLILIPESVCQYWTACPRNHPADEGDYGRACSIEAGRVTASTRAEHPRRMCSQRRVRQGNATPVESKSSGKEPERPPTTTSWSSGTRHGFAGRRVGALYK
ncbi:Imm21 family immunity protein [Streptomyces sp. NPDC006510]|uniref:Imm21 family immunity protein n=1 Tax=Streptomyces sp. NPDC006510 TaxID=3155600 RepID=UPI0033A8210A